MESIDIRDFGGQGLDLEQRLAAERALRVTNAGKPVAVILSTSEASSAPCIEAPDPARGRLAIKRNQQEWIELGMEELTMEEINAEIKAYRRERDGD